MVLLICLTHFFTKVEANLGHLLLQWYGHVESILASESTPFTWMWFFSHWLKCFWHHQITAVIRPMQTFLKWKFINSLASGKFEWDFRYVIFKQILVIDGCGISYEIALILMSLDSADDQSTLVQVMAWCPQTASHYLSQCWPRYLSPYCVSRPQCVNFYIYFYMLSYWKSIWDQVMVFH